jgi:hypothetical protein
MVKLLLPVAYAWPDQRSNYADSKLQREQYFSGVLELKSGVRLLREVYTRNKRYIEQRISWFFADAIAGRMEHAQVQPELDGLAASSYPPRTAFLR